MKKKLSLVTAVVFLALGGWFARTAYRAHRNLVTLHVHNAALRIVTRQIEWQTWERILVHRQVDGKVTLNVNEMPLERVLRIISEQTSSRWMAVYPLYSARPALDRLHRIVLGNGGPEPSGWSAFQPRPPGFARGMLAATAQTQNEPVSLKFYDKDIGVAVLALARIGQTQVVPEDATTGNVQLDLAGATMPQAVAQLARQVNRRWTRFYTLQPGFQFETVRREEVAPDPPSASDPLPEPALRPRELPPEQLQRLEQQFNAQLETMTPAERQRALDRRTRWQELRNLTPAERRQRFEQLASDPQFQQRMQQRMLQRLRDSTPDQRVQRDQRIAQRRNERAQR